MSSVVSCPHLPACSGCSSIGIEYSEQLDAKLRSVRALFQASRLRTFDGGSINKITPSPKPCGYRNRVRLVPRRDGEQIALGLYQAGSHRVVDIPGCPVQPDGINAAIEVIRAAIRDLNVPLYDEVEHTGDLKFVTVREAAATGELLVGFVTRTETFPQGGDLARYVMDDCPGAVGVVQNINPQKGNIIFGPTSRALLGRDYIEELVCGIRVQLDLTSFFQANTAVAVKAYEAIIANAITETPSSTTSETPTILLDLYAGVGTIGLIAAKHATRVIGVEEFDRAVALARTAARANRIGNIEFHVGLVEEFLARVATESAWRQDCGNLVAVVNPPRKGLDSVALGALVEAKPVRIAYLSCAPRTLLRDLIEFERGGHRIVSVELFDMFPQTEQVETLAVLERADFPRPRT